MKIFPRILYRIAGGAFEDFLELNMTDSTSAVRRIKNHRIKLNELKIILCEDLYSLINNQQDEKIQKELLNLKRNVFNLRLLRDDKIALVTPYLEQKTIVRILQYNVFLTSYGDELLQGKLLYEAELSNKRKSIINLANKESFLKGLMLSSQTLFIGLKKYCHKNGIGLVKKDFQVELSIIKYLSRMHCKTSPYSTFTSLAMGTIHNASASKKEIFVAESENEGALISSSHIRLNNYLLRHLRILLLHNKVIRKNLEIRTNPTIKSDNSYYLFLTNNENIESFQRVTKNEVVSVIYELVHKSNGLVYNSLIQLIINHEYFEASELELEELIDKLINCGFLEFDFGVSGLDPEWDLKLVKKLKPQSEIKQIAQLITALINLRQSAERFANADSMTRPIILSKAYHEIELCCLELRNSIENRLIEQNKLLASVKPNLIDFHLPQEVLFCEDSSMNVTPSVENKALENVIHILNSLMKEVLMLEKIDEKQQMFSYFKSKYKAAKKIDLLTFYEDYYRDIKRSGLVKKDEYRKNLNQNQKMFDTEKQAREDNPLQKLTEAFDIHILPEVNLNHSVCHLSLNQIKRVTESISKEANPLSTPLCYTAFIQHFVDDSLEGENKLCAVVNGVYPGWGKMFTRFLHMFDDTSNEFIKWNSDPSGEYIFMENNDASFFNANIHPPLMQHEILTPNGSNNLPKDQLLPVMDFEVSPDWEKNELALFHKPTNKRAYVFDLSFEVATRRSELYQLLNNFTLLKNATYRPLIDIINERFIMKGDVIVYPRIVIEDSLILQRKAWIIKKNDWPVKESNESDWSYFLKVNEWRDKLDLPRNVFIYIDPSREPLNIANNKLTKDDYKPQYMDFENPFLVFLLERLIDKSTLNLRVVEMLPNVEKLNKIGKKSHVIESLVEWSIQTSK